MKKLWNIVLYCSALEYTRNPVIGDISHEVDLLLNKPYFSDLTDEKFQIILDCIVLVDQQNRKLQTEQLSSLEFHSRRLTQSSWCQIPNVENNPKKTTLGLCYTKTSIT